MSEFVVVPLPSSPLALLPQHSTVAFGPTIAQAWSSPAATWVAVEIALTTTGVACVAAVVPFPSWPSWPSPQHEIGPPLRAQPKKPPIATSDTPVTPGMATGVALPLELVPLPRPPWSAAPQQASPPLGGTTAHVSSLPADIEAYPLLPETAAGTAVLADDPMPSWPDCPSPQHLP